MFAYYLRLAVLSLRRNPMLTALNVGAIAIGIGVCMTTLTLYHIMSGNPMGAAGARVHAVQIDSWGADDSFRDNRPELIPWELTWRDATAISNSGVPALEAAMFKAAAVLQVANEDIQPSMQLLRVTGRDFFELFDTPFKYGGAWSEDAERAAEQVVVLSAATNDTAFGGENSVGKRVRLDGRDYLVVGVLDEWDPLPKFYDVNNGPFDAPEDAFIPISLTVPLELDSSGNTNCWKDEKLDSFEDFMAGECVWLQYWVELEDAQQKDRYQSFLDNYVRDQQALGRLERPVDNRLTPVAAWLDVREVVRDDNKVLVGLSFMFLAVCLFNAVGLVLAKFAGKAPQVGLRRALGASTRAIFTQHLVETGLVGLAGGVAGLALTALGLAGIRALDDHYEALTQLDVTMVASAILIAVISGIVAGLYPTWRICRIAPAGYLKTQ
ncbi:MAG: ABC transporter permease [Pseudomonadota bacterium]